MSDIVSTLFHCWFELLLWHRRGIAETWGRHCSPNSCAEDHQRQVVGGSNMLICYCTVNQNLSVWSLILHCCTAYWWSSNFKLLTLVLWIGFIYGANLPYTLSLWVRTVAVWCFQGDWQKVRKVGSLTKTQETSLTWTLVESWQNRLKGCSSAGLCLHEL